MVALVMPVFLSRSKVGDYGPQALEGSVHGL